MGNWLSKFGAQPTKPVRYGILWQNRMASGIWTQRDPLRDAASSRIEEEFYGARGDAFIGGLNTEISPKLTLIRRPGSSVYNDQNFPAITRFYENRTVLYNANQTAASEKIQVVCDTASTVYDCTGPSTQNSLFTKTTGAGSTFFQSVGNTLYFTDGPDRKKLLTPSKIWAPNQTFNVGDQILDPNGNIEVVQGTGSATITGIQVISSKLGIVSGPYHYFLAVTFGSNVYWTANTPVSFSGVTNYPSINGLTLNVVVDTHYLPPSPNVAYFPAPTPTLYGPAPDTGTATSTTNTGGGTSGTTQPTWGTMVGQTTSDNQLTWQNFGVPLYDWQHIPPANAPSLIAYPGNRQWTPSTTLSYLYSILDNNNNVQVAINYTGSGNYTTGPTTPTWNTSIPNAVNPSSGQTIDGTIVWQNCGPILSWTADTPYYSFQCILDSNQNLQIAFSGTGSGSHSGATPPAWQTAIGASTTGDGTLTWLCIGPGAVILTGQVQYAYSWHSIDGSLTTASPLVTQNYGSQVLGPPGSPRAQLTGNFPTDPQIDAAWVWRTVQGGSVLFFDSAIPNPTPGSSSSWFLVDVVPDTSLNELIEAPIANSNNPPPVGLGALAYHLDCIFGVVGNSVQYSDGPLVTSGLGDTAWSPENIFVFPSTPTRLFPSSTGLWVFTTSGVYIIQGLNTASSPLFAVPMLQNIGLQSYDAFTVNGSIVMMYTSDNQVITLDPSSGVSEIGFPIGDQFGPGMGTGTFTPTSAHLTWHVAGSQDKGLYVADFKLGDTGTWWRMTPTPSPETGTTWSPMAQIAAGFSAVQSVETVPGTHTLLIGPPIGFQPPPHELDPTTGPILQRDYSVYTDNGAAYPAYAILGSMVLAQPGQIAMVESFTTDSVLVGSPITLAVQLDEIAPLSAGYFENLILFSADPEELSPSQSVYAQRFYLSQTQQPAVCRHLQLQINFGTEAAPNQLLSLSCFGAYEQSK